MVAALLLLGAIFFYFARNMRKEEAVSNRARKETADILRTVNEGLFLLDKDLKLGSERSMALNTIFRREEFNDITFDNLLKEIVPEKTLRTAMDYVALLWGERVNEKLVKTINPLNEVEVHFDNPAGGFDTHFLEFDFNRVKSEGSLSHLLVTVNDVTKRVMLSRELQESQEKAQAQLDLLLRILHVDPDSLTGFLTDADVSLKMVNSILKEPAREESAFRAKIDGIYRQVHAVKGEAAALGLKTVEQRAHAFEESLNDLKGRQTLSGSDFLPLVVKLDDLFNHLAQVREMLSRLVDLHQAIATRGGKPGEPNNPDSKAEQLLGTDKTMQMQALGSADGEASASSGLDRTLEDLAAKRREQSVEAGVRALPRPGSRSRGLRRAVKDITIQLVRNAVVHGIETPDERSKAHKAETGDARDRIQLARQRRLRARRAGRRPWPAARSHQGSRGRTWLDHTGSGRIARSAPDHGADFPTWLFDGRSRYDRCGTRCRHGPGAHTRRRVGWPRRARFGGGRFSKFKIWLPATERAVAA